jgi:hypothetical protein
MLIRKQEIVEARMQPPLLVALEAMQKNELVREWIGGNPLQKGRLNKTEELFAISNWFSSVPEMKEILGEGIDAMVRAFKGQDNTYPLHDLHPTLQSAISGFRGVAEGSGIRFDVVGGSEVYKLYDGSDAVIQERRREDSI